MDPTRFSGTFSEDHVLSFIRKFERRFRNTLGSQEMADYMYMRYLADNIKPEVRSVKDNYKEMVKTLKNRCGDSEKIFSSEKARLQQVEKPLESDGEAVQKSLAEVVARLDKMVKIVNFFEDSYGGGFTPSRT